MQVLSFEIRDERQLKALIGLSFEQLSRLETAFFKAYEEMKRSADEEGKAKGNRQRGPGGGKKGKLRTIRDKLIFLLYYLKVYPTFDVLGTQFGLSRSKACENVHKLAPVLHRTLADLEMLPHREFHSVEELKSACKGLDQIIIDATERRHERPQDSKAQSDLYSGKKKVHTVKNTIISSVTKVILFIGHTFSGHTHDYTMLKSEFSPQLGWFEELRVLLDLGYQGIRTDYIGSGIEIPHKKPRKSKANPAPQLTDEQKEENRALSHIRILVENAIAGLKRYNILVHAFRNKKDQFEDDVIALGAGLWNFSLSAPVI